MQIKVESSWFISFFLLNGNDLVITPRQGPINNWDYNYSSSSYRAFMIKNFLSLSKLCWDFLEDKNTLKQSLSLISFLSNILWFIPEDISYFKRSIRIFLYWELLSNAFIRHFFFDNLKRSIYFKINRLKTLFYYRKSKY